MLFAGLYNIYLGKGLSDESSNLADIDQMYYLDLKNCLG